MLHPGAFTPYRCRLIPVYYMFMNVVMFDTDSFSEIFQHLHVGF